MVIPVALLLPVEEELVHETFDGMVKFCASVKSAHCVIQVIGLDDLGKSEQPKDLPDKGSHHLH